MTNCLVDIATADGRDYVTPEDVDEALKSVPVDTVRMAVLEIIGRQVDVGMEDSGLCAFVAWEGPTPEEVSTLCLD